MTVSTLNPAREFASAVRLALADLPADEVDDLTDGLEADLAERAADGSADFGDPLEYASELRMAAGLPPRSRRRRFAKPVSSDFRAKIVREWRRVSNHPLAARLLAFFVALRPLWWVARAWTIYGVVAWAVHVPTLQLTPLTFVLGVGILIVSVQWGRGKWLPRQWMRSAVLVLNVVLVAAIPVTIAATAGAFDEQNQQAYDQGQHDQRHAINGLTYDGRTITNIFAYDAHGKALTLVQLYDQTGRPLYTVPETGDSTLPAGQYLVPNKNILGRGGWNVYPLSYLTAIQMQSEGNPFKEYTPTVSKLGSLLVKPLKNAPPLPTPTPAPTATPAP